MSGLDSPTDRLYAGALLGKALTKELGEVGGQQDQIAQGERKATLLAGVASGKINPKSLSGQDASILGDALKGNQLRLPGASIPSISDPLEFAGGLLGNLAKGGGEFLENLPKVPQGLYSLGKAGVQELGKGIWHAIDIPQYPVFAGEPKSEKAPLAEKLEQIAKGVKHEFSSPHQIYEHPFGPLLDVAGVATGGASLAIKGAGALSRTGLVDAGSLEAPTLAGRVIKLGSIEGRPGVTASPGFTAENADKLAEVGIEPSRIPREYSPKLGMKYAVQKPLDYAISKLKEVKLPGQEETIGDLQGRYYGKKLINATRGQISAGTTESVLSGPIPDLTESISRMYKGNPEAGGYQFEAARLHSIGVENTEQLDEYANRIREGEDEDGLIVTPAMEKGADYLANKLYQDPRFRQLIDDPTDAIKEVAYNMRRVAVDQGFKLGIDPNVVESSAFGRLKELTGKSIEEVKAELPNELRPENDFAKGLQVIQEVLLGKATPEVAPPLTELASKIPYGTQEQRVNLLERAVNSLREDISNHNSVLDRRENPDYLQGNNLFDKIAVGLHQEFGLDMEQAGSFARGIALGSPEGPILPTYIPSVSPEKLNFGIAPEKLRTKVGRALGVSRFRPIEDIERQPSYYELNRPFNPRTASAENIGLGSAKNYLKQASYEPFLRGMERFGPEAIIKNAIKIQSDLVKDRLNQPMIDRLAIKAPDGTAKLYSSKGQMVEDLGQKASLYELVPVDTWRNYLKTITELPAEIARGMSEWKQGSDLQAEIDGLVEESAQRFVSEEMAKASAGRIQGVALPLSYVKTIVNHARISEQGTGLGRILSYPNQFWKTLVLSFNPAWFFRTTIGHGILALIDGTSPVGWLKAHSYFLDDRPVTTDQLRSISWGKKYGDSILNPQKLPYGINQGGLQQEVEDIQGRRVGELFVPKHIGESVHVQNNFQRRAIFLSKLNAAVKQRLAELGKDFDHPGGFWNSKNIDAALDPEWLKDVLKQPDLIEHVLDQVHKVSYTFGQMAPWERQLVRYGMPFYGWVKFVKKFVWGMPINYPGRTNAIAAIGKLGAEEDSNLGPMPSYLSGALWFDAHDLSKAKYVNVYGLNPLGEGGENPLGKEGFLKGLMSPSQTAPISQAVIAGFGINPLTLEREEVDPRSGIEQGKYGELIDTKTGQEVSITSVNPVARMLGTFLRSFPEVRTAEQALTGGNPVYPESIPFLNEKPIGVNPISRRDNTFWSFLGQELGVQPRTYNLEKHAADLLKSVEEARKRNRKTIAKAEAKLAAPNP